MLLVPLLLLVFVPRDEVTENSHPNELKKETLCKLR